MTQPAHKELTMWLRFEDKVFDFPGQRKIQTADFLAVIAVFETLGTHHLNPWFVFLVLTMLGPVTGIVDGKKELHVSVGANFTDDITILMNSFCRA
jgi:hypothetical protein